MSFKDLEKGDNTHYQYYDESMNKNNQTDFSTKSFAEKSVRAGFIRKVLSIVGLQLLVTFGTVLGVSFNDTATNFVQKHVEIYYSCLISTIVLLIALFCFARKHPINMVLLGLFTLVESYTIAVYATFYNPGSVVFALGITVCTVLVLVTYAFFTKRDFTAWLDILIICSFFLFIWGMFSLFFPIDIGWFKIYAGIAALLTCAYIVIDIQMICGGKRLEFTPDDYIFAAITIYLDIINLFVYILAIFGDRR